MDLGVISVRYARALLKSATENKLERQVYSDMCLLADSYLQVAELREAINNPMLVKSKKAELLRTACGSAVCDITERFIDLVLDADRENALQFMANSYMTLYREKENIINGKIITATDITPDTKEKMCQIVKDRTHGVVEMQTEVNPDIIGGFILEYDTYRMDASVKAKLNSILATLKN